MGDMQFDGTQEEWDALVNKNKSKSMTAVEYLIEQLPIRVLNSLQKEIEQAKKMEKEQHGKTWDKALDTYVLRGANYVRAWQDFDDYYNETFGSKGSDERIVEATKTISYQKLDCPYDFTSRCTMGSCDCKPIKETTSSQTEISDEEICKQAEIEYPFGDYDRDNWLRRRGFIKGMIKYREQLKKK